MKRAKEGGCCFFFFFFKWVSLQQAGMLMQDPIGMREMMRDRNVICTREKSGLDKRKLNPMHSGGLSFRTEHVQLTWKRGKAETLVQL